MREKSATADSHQLVIACPACIGTGWVRATSDDGRNLRPSCRGQFPNVCDLTIVCPVCHGRSWVPAVAEEVGR